MSAHGNEPLSLALQLIRANALGLAERGFGKWAATNLEAARRIEAMARAQSEGARG